MANKIQQKPLGEAYKGTISTFIVTLMILGIGFFLPQITANKLENARRGETIWTPSIEYKEFLLWSIESDADFNSVRMKQASDDGYYNAYHQWGGWTGSYGVEYYKTGYWYEGYGGGEDFNNYWIYRTKLTNAQGRYKMLYKQIDYDHVDTTFPDSDKVDGNYMTGLTIWRDINLHSSFYPIANPMKQVSYHTKNDAHSGHYYSEQLHYWLKLDIDDWIDNDATTLRTYIKFRATYDYCKFQARAYSQNTGNYHTIDTKIIDVSPGTIMLYLESDITLDDLIAIKNLESQGDLCLRIKYLGTNEIGQDVKTVGLYYQVIDTIIFDASVLGLSSIEEEKPTQWLSTMDKYSIYMVLESILIFGVGFVMLPQLSIGRLAEMLGLIKKANS